MFRHGPIIIYTRLPAGGTYYPICRFPTNSERLIGISDAFSAFVYGYLSSCPRAHCTPNKSTPTLCYTCRHGLRYTGHACKNLLSAVPWISEDRLLLPCFLSYWWGHFPRSVLVVFEFCLLAACVSHTCWDLLCSSWIYFRHSIFFFCTVPNFSISIFVLFRTSLPMWEIQVALPR